MKEAINEIRSRISGTEVAVQTLKTTIGTTDLTTRPDVQPDFPAADRGEMLANVTLAYRHLEDARMRLGKVIQAYEGGVSVYDRMGKIPSAPGETVDATEKPPAP